MGGIVNRNDKKSQSISDEVNERVRSVSYSSDKFPPASLNLARVSHQDQLPVSPSYTMSGVVPLPANVYFCTTTIPSNTPTITLPASNIFPAGKEEGVAYSEVPADISVRD